MCYEDLMVNCLSSDMIHNGMDDEAIIHAINESLRDKITELNNQRKSEVDNHISSAVNNVISGVKYRFVDVNGQNLQEVTEKTPLVEM